MTDQRSNSRPVARSARKGSQSGSKISSHKSGPASTFRGNLEKVTWSQYEMFLNIVEAKGVRGAAMSRNCSINTVRNCLDRMEDMLGSLVVLRGRREEFRLTSEGKRVFKIAREMKLAGKIAASVDSGGPSAVRIAATEGLGTYWLTPRIMEFQNETCLEIKLRCDMQRVDPESSEYDIAIQLVRPQDAVAQCFRLGTLHLMLFASPAYLRRVGEPRSVDDWRQHSLVWQEADQVASELLPAVLGTADTERLIKLTTNSSLAHFRAVAAGSGIGVLPTYARAISRLVQPIDIEVRLRREILCMVNPLRARVPEVQRALAWVISAFSGDTYPWFRDEFVHPRDFETRAMAPNVTRLFEGYIDGLDPTGTP